MTQRTVPTLEHELRQSQTVHLPDFGLLKSQCIAFGQSIPPPVDSINKIPGYESSYLRTIDRLGLNIPTPVQSHLWPILFRGRSASCVSAPKSGKTLSYLIPALSDGQFKDQDPDPNKLIYGDEGPKVVVVCSGVNRVFEIRDQVESILGRRNYQRVLLLVTDDEDRVASKLLNGCDVLIGTPGSMSRLIDNGCVRFDVCALLVFDDADRSFTLQPEFIKSIVLAYLKAYKKRFNIKNDVDGLLTAPMLILADSWTKEVQKFSTEYTKNSIFIFGDLFEAAIAHNLKYKVTFLPSESYRIGSLSDLVHSLLCRGRLNRIAIVCSNDEEAARVFEAMQDLDVFPISIDSSKFNYEMPKLIEMARTHPRVVTIITDQKIKETPQLNFIDTLIHFSMPNHTDTFRSRFMLMSYLIKKKDPSINTHFLLSSVNGNHAHFLCQALRRVSDIPIQLAKLRTIAQRPLCENFLAFCHCPFASTFCINRHQFKLTEPINKQLPVDGQIRFEITHVISANQFYLRLVEYRDSESESGKWAKFKFQYRSINAELQTFKDETKSIEEKVPIVSKIYGLDVMGTVHRVKVTANLGQLTTNMPLVPDSPQQLDVSFIDFGYRSKAMANQLIPLPKHLRDYPPLAIRSYVLGIRPTDNEIEWNHRPSESLTNFLREYRALVGTAWIKLQRMSIFWLDEMKIIESLEHLGRSVVSWSPESDLISYGLAAKNEQTFSRVNNNNQELCLRWYNHTLEKSAFPAFFSDRNEHVYLTHFIGLRHFYVVKQNDFKCLEDLERELNRMVLRPMKVFLPNCLGAGVLKTRESKSISRIRIIEHHPTEKMVRVFFVDWGETYKIPEDCVSIIDERFIKRLPFQAIKCSLVGVEGKVDPNLVYDLTRTENEIFKDVLIEKLDGNKENGYEVRVFYETKKTIESIDYYSLSAWLVDEGHCRYVEDEGTRETVINIPNANAIDADDDEDDAVTKAERRCAENLLDKVSEGMQKMLIGRMIPDPVQFDPKKLSKRKRLMLTIKRIEEEKRRKELNLAETDASDDEIDWPSDDEDEPVRDYSRIRPYDSSSSSEESEVESDIEELNIDDD